MRKSTSFRWRCGKTSFGLLIRRLVQAQHSLRLVASLVSWRGSVIWAKRKRRNFSMKVMRELSAWRTRSSRTPMIREPQTFTWSPILEKILRRFDSGETGSAISTRKFPIPIPNLCWAASKSWPNWTLPKGDCHKVARSSLDMDKNRWNSGQKWPPQPGEGKMLFCESYPLEGHYPWTRWPFPNRTSRTS